MAFDFNSKSWDGNSLTGGKVSCLKLIGAQMDAVWGRGSRHWVPCEWGWRERAGEIPWKASEVGAVPLFFHPTLSQVNNREFWLVNLSQALNGILVTFCVICCNVSTVEDTWHLTQVLAFPTSLDNTISLAQSCSQLHSLHLHSKAIVFYPNHINKMLETALLYFNKTFLAIDDNFLFRRQGILS